MTIRRRLLLFAASIALLSPLRASDVEIPSEAARSASSLRVTTQGLRVEASTTLTTAAGTIVFWVNPDFGPDAAASHTFLSARWSGDDHSYLVISDGWWEPAGAGLLYFVLSNEDQVHCTTPYDLPRGEWSMLAVTWAAGRCEIYVDGAARTSVTKTAPKQRTATRMSLGADDATAIVRQRTAPGRYAQLRTYDVALTPAQLAELFERDRLAGVSAADADWRWLDRALTSAPALSAETGQRRNVIFDEGHHWGTSRDETDKRLARVARAGFNVYAPTIWYGGGAYYASDLVHQDPGLTSVLTRDDPVAYLLQQAHARGVEVHGSFTIVQRTDDRLPQFFGPGVPPKAYDVHNPKFRDFIVAVVAEAAETYRFDGVNLDYIRAIGICSSPSCRRDYNLATGRNLGADLLVRFTSDAAGRAIAQWQQRAVHDIVSRIRSRLAALDRPITLSVCFNSSADTPYSLEGREVALWLREGLVDLAFDMQYVKRLDVAGIDRFRDSLESPDRHVILLANWDRATDATVTARSPARMRQLAEFSLRHWPQSGFGLYLYNQLNDSQIEALQPVLGPAVAAPKP